MHNVTLTVTTIIMIIAIASIVVTYYKKLAKLKEDKVSLKQLAVSLMTSVEFQALVRKQISVITDEIKEHGIGFETIKEYTKYLSTKLDTALYDYIMSNYPQFARFVTEENIVYITDEILKLIGFDFESEAEKVIVSDKVDTSDTVDEDFETPEASDNEVEEDTVDGTVDEDLQ